MAEVIEDFDFEKVRKQNAKYPYLDWFNGKVWKITRNVDFQIPAKSMQINLYAAASRYGMRLRTTLIGDNELVIQAIEWEDDDEA